VSGVAELRHKVLALKPLRKAIGNPRFVAVGKRVAPRTDLVLQRLSGGRLAMSELAGLPFLVLHTVGRRSGLPRATPLICRPTDQGFLVVGSNWGQTGQPAWALNLRAEPDVSVDFRGRRRAVTARLLAGDERAAAWAQVSYQWPPFDDYVVRAGGRELMVFLLSPKD
jgi:deazaflavin-dependent oxidoreductase (nitroreductase family)